MKNSRTLIGSKTIRLIRLNVYVGCTLVSCQFPYVRLHPLQRGEFVILVSKNYEILTFCTYERSLIDICGGGLYNLIVLVHGDVLEHVKAPFRTS